MGSLTLSVKKTDADAIDYAVTIADADIDRLAQAYGASYFPAGVEVSPADGETAAVIRLPTSIEIVTAIANGLVDGMLANVISFERQRAVEAAQASVAPINASPV